MTAAVTGGTGFLGLRLVRLLLERDEQVIALGRAGQRPAVDRIAEFLLHSGVGEAERTRLLRGLRVVDIDLERPRMGLSERVFQKLADSIDIIWHCGGSTSFRDDEQVLRTNVAGAQAVTALASAGIRQPTLCHTSTVSVVGSQQRGIVREEEVRAEPTEFNSLYERSKFEAERIVCDWSRDTGRPAVIFRPSGLIARSPRYRGCPPHPLQAAARVGKSLFDVAQMVLGESGEAVPIPLVTKESKTNLIPVDHAAFAMLEVVRRRPPRALSFYHIVNQVDVALTTVAEAFSEYFGISLYLAEQGMEIFSEQERAMMSEFGLMDDFAAYLSWATISREYDVTGLTELDLLCPDPLVDKDFIVASLD
ncbi:SDR family oxidoreductase [Nocardia alba]|uniref:Male sterility protein n=1 Tax=Nocardia alba TaxID=225051 RepID=A0A4R1FQ82_9NOCA|nr:SDR family oxidoreductase [Nocardia alba]TCJ97366.1 male sterility protein [Nocardia alba]